MELFSWLNKWYHINWIAKVGGDLLHKKGIKVEDYFNDLVELKFPLDTLGLLVIVRMFHNYIAIILKECIWTTQGNNDIDRCSIFLIYSGGVNFVDTCTGRPSFLSDHSMSDLENIDEQIDAINLCQSLVEIVLKPQPARMRHAAPKQDHNYANKCSTRYGLRSSAPKKPVKPKRNTRNSNKVLMNINLDSLLAGNRQKNAQKKQEPVVVVDSEMETVESTDDEMKPNAPKQVDSGSNKEIESTEEPSKDNKTENIENNAMDVTEEPNKDNEIVHIENNAMDVTETEPNKENKTVDSGNNAMDVTEEPNKENETVDSENNAMDVTETEPNKEDEKDKTVSENNERNVPATEANSDKDVTDNEVNKDNETEAKRTENNEKNVPVTEANSDKDVTDNEANKDNETEEKGTENSDKDVTDNEANNDNETEEKGMEANKDNKTGNSEPEDNAMDVNPTEQNEEKGMENGASDNTDTEQNKGNKQRKAKPSELKEKYPILEAFRNVQNQEELEILLVDYKKKKLGSSKVSETEIQTQNGTVNVKQYGLLKSPIRKDMSLACTECEVKKTTIAELTKHIKEAHPGFK